MFAVVYIAVSLLQISFTQELTEYEHEVPHEEPSIYETSNEFVEEPAILDLPEDIHDVESDTINGETIEALPTDIVNLSGVVGAKGKVTIAAHYGCDGACGIGFSDEEAVNNKFTDEDAEIIPKDTTSFGEVVKAQENGISSENFGCEDNHSDAGSSDEEKNEDNTLIFHGPVKAKGRVSITAHYGCGDNQSDAQSSEEEQNEDQTIIFRGPVKAKGRVSINAHYGCGDSQSDAQTSQEATNEDQTVIIRGPVKAKGRVSINAHYGYGDSQNDAHSSEEEKNEDDTLFFYGPVKAKGRVSMATHYGCGGSNINSITSHETQSVKEDIEEESKGITFDGTIHAQGNMSIGVNYSGPDEMVPVYHQSPWSSTSYYPQFYIPCIYYPGYIVQYYTFAMPEMEIQDFGNLNYFLETRPLARILSNSVAGGDEIVIDRSSVQMGNKFFNRMVPASGSVAIVARF